MAVTIYRQENTPRFRGVLFDMDGLVLDSERLYTRFWREAARYFGFELSLEQALQLRGLGRKPGEALLHSFFGPGADYMTIRAKRIELMDIFVAQHGIALKPGIHELLDYMDRQGIPGAITSSSPPEKIREHLSRHGLDTRFRALCSGHEMPNGKPAPDIYLYGAASLGLDPRECLALEDAPAGILSAHRAGCWPVMIPDQDQPDPQTEALLYAKADSLEDIIQLL